MNKLAVLETPGGNIGELICEALRRLKNSGGFVSASVSSLPSVENGLEPDLLIVPGRAGRLGTALPPSGSCGILLIPGALNAPQGIRAGKVVKYGMSGDCSVTLSSIGETRSMLSVRRTLPTLSGSVIERQEFPVRHAPRASPEDTIACAAALLMLGATPDMLVF